ncbi:MAG: glycosyltransferase family 39 protein, partial [Actinobacteria bacterium]|nr:glycosyltransferase family 39 protein [Actinomycetota bacterium]
MKWLERVPAWAVLTGLVVSSTALRSVAARGVGSPWIAPDEMIYALLGRSLWGSGELSILGGETGFYSLLYPALVGLPLSIADAETGHATLHVLQAFVVSCTAIPIYLWGRRLLRRSYALLAAALTLALPSLGYSALVMSETLFLPVATLALWALARALERPTAGRQVLLGLAVTAAMATRLQAVVFVPVVVTAVLVKATLDRDRFVLRRFEPGLVAIGALTVGAAILAGSGAFGAYAAAGQGSYEFGAAARFVGYHAAGVLLISGIVPALGLLLLWITAIPAHGTPRELRAFLAVSLAYIPWLVLEVGVFASREIGHLASRDLATAAPLTLLGFAIWLERGARRPQPLSSIVALLAAGGLLILPIRQLAEIDTIHDTFELIPLSQMAPGGRELAFGLAVAVATALVVVLPRRALGLLVPVVLAALAFTSIVAAREAARQSGLRETALLGGSPTWIDDAGVDRVAYLYAGDPRWTVVWQHLYWNRSIGEVWTLAGSTVPGPLPQRAVFPRSDGRLATSSTLADAHAVVAPTNVTLVGERIAEIRQQEQLAAGLALW